MDTRAPFLIKLFTQKFLYSLHKNNIICSSQEKKQQTPDLAN